MIQEEAQSPLNVDVEESIATSFGIKNDEKADSLRPQFLSDYIGQQAVKKIVSITVESAKIRAKSLDHVLVHGLPGLGKTTLAQVIANELKTSIQVTSGQAIEKPGDLAAILANLEQGSILFIDEIHRLKPKVEEVLYTAMEDFLIDLVVGKGVTAKSLRLETPPFTLIGATTMLNKLSMPLRDRFGLSLKLEHYSEEDILQILKNNSIKLDFNVADEVLRKLASCARSTPRVANHLLKRLIDYAVVHEVDRLVESDVDKLMDLLHIQENGLNKTDIELIGTIHDMFEGGPVGIDALSACLREDRDNLELLYEPFLMQQGLLKRTQRGRLLTDKGIEFARKIKN